MATIRTYTTIEQSRKLAEILPIESADMMYSPPMLTHFKNYGDADKEQELPDYMVILVRRNIINSSEFDEPIPIRKGDVPAWSLGALINIIPQELFDGEYIINITEGLNCKWIISYEPRYEVSSYINVSSDSLIDCCVEMIIKLKERNLLWESLL